MKRVIFPELDELFSPANAPHYPFEKSTKEALNDPFFILHSSGSSSPQGYPTVRFFDVGRRVDLDAEYR